jgi:hypothetical protein
MPLPWEKSALERPAAPRVKLSIDGNEKMRLMIPQGFKYMVLSSIKKQEPSCTLSDVAKDLNWEESKARDVMEQLYSDRLIERIN